MTPQLEAIKSLAAEFQQSGGIAGHLDRLQSIGVNPPAGPPQPPADGVDGLRRLGELRASGALTEKQFAAAKAELLRRL
jgi:hypothetical protein